jgi:hypothetical protein
MMLAALFRAFKAPWPRSLREAHGKALPEPWPGRRVMQAVIPVYPRDPRLKAFLSEFRRSMTG